MSDNIPDRPADYDLAFSGMEISNALADYAGKQGRLPPVTEHKDFKCVMTHLPGGIIRLELWRS